MTVRCFFDTNVLVYTDDETTPAKRSRALELTAVARRHGTGVVSTQVLQEYFVTVTRKLGVDSALARRKVEILARFDVVPLSLDLILTAVDLHRLHGMSLWDSLILQAARSAGCSILYTEDLQHGWRLGDLTIVDPFREE